MEILYEDNHLIAVNKLPGEIVQGDKTGDIPLLENVREYIKKKYNKTGNVYTGLVHRLDRPVSGVTLFTKTSKGLSRMNELFREKETQKIYWAIVKNRPTADEGTLVHYLVKNEKQNKSYAYPGEVPNSKKAILHYKTIKSSDNYHLLEIVLETGRHHQIRCQMAAIGSAVKGDLKYGFPRSNPDGSISLHARSLSFIHPVKKSEVIIVANPPTDPLWDFFKE